MKKFIFFAAFCFSLILTACSITFEDDKEVLGQGDSQAISMTIAIPEVDIKIILPQGYELNKNSELQRGSIASYEISTQENPDLYQEIQFYTKESIEAFNLECRKSDVICPNDHHPSPELYMTQKTAFEKGENYIPLSSDKTVYELKEFNGRNYFVSNFSCPGDACITREYTTFIDDIKMDYWTTIFNESEAKEADILFGKLEIIE